MEVKPGKGKKYGVRVDNSLEAMILTGAFAPKHEDGWRGYFGFMRGDSKLLTHVMKATIETDFPIEIEMSDTQLRRAFRQIFVHDVMNGANPEIQYYGESMLRVMHPHIASNDN